MSAFNDAPPREAGPPPVPDLHEMGRFLARLFADAARMRPDALVELSFDSSVPDAKGRHDINQSRSFPAAAIEKLVAKAESLNRLGSRVYIGAALRRPDAPRDRRTRKEHACLATAIPVDFDAEGAAEEALERCADAPPSLIVETGSVPWKRQQFWWVLAEPLADMEAFEALMKRLARALNADPLPNGRQTLMRLSGGVAWPRKEGRVPELVRIVFETEAAYSVDDLETAFPVSEGPSGSHGERRGPRERARNQGGKVNDGRESFMRDVIFSALMDFAGENGRWPNHGELFALAWDRYKDNVDLSRDGRSADEVSDKVRKAVRKAREGAFGEVEDIAAQWKPRRGSDGNRSDGKLLSEDAVATEFANRFESRVRFCATRGIWRRWNGNYWAPDKTNRTFHDIRLFVRELSRERRASPKLRTACSGVRFSSAVERFAKADPVFATVHKQWDGDPLLLGTPGGTVDLRTGELHPGRQEDMISKSTAVAPSEAEDCPRWLEFLKEALGADQEMIGYLKRLSGCALTGETREQCLAFLYGDGGNGKGVFLNAISEIMGDYARTAPMDTFIAFRGEKHSTEIAFLWGARLVVASETEKGRPWAETRIKTLTGGDALTARFIRQDFFTFKPEFTLIISGNYRPPLNNVDSAVKRRFHMIPFIRKPPEPDKELPEKLKAEYPGVLRWMINGALEWMAVGLRPPEKVISATAAYFEQQDLFGSWLEEACDVDPENRCKSEHSTPLYASWLAFLRAAGEQIESRKSFSERLGVRFVRRRTKGGTLYQGIRLRSPLSQED